MFSQRQQAFLQARSNDIGSKLELIGCLNNGKGLSLYFPSITSTIKVNGEYEKTTRAFLH